MQARGSDPPADGGSCRARRSLLLGAAGVLTGAGGAVAQPRAPQTIGFLSSNSSDAVADSVRRFETRLSELGLVEGRDVIHERRFAMGRMETLPSLAEDLLRKRPDVIVAPNNPEIGAVVRMGVQVPVVMVFAEDAVGSGWIRSLANPGGNVTGMQANVGQAYGRRLQLLKESVPGLGHVALLRQRRAQSARQSEGVDAAARTLGLTVSVFEIGTVDDYDVVFPAIQASGARAMCAEPGQLNYLAAERIARFARDARLPAAGSNRRLAERGLLMSVGPDLGANYRRAADYVAKILRGARPAELPVEQSTKYEVVINATTARTLGIRIPPAVLASADSVID